MRLRLLRCVPPIVLLLAVSSVSAQTPEEIFNRGNAAYEDDRYEDAAEDYRSLLRYKIQDAVVEYNLANTEFRLGNLGRAILHYERARRLDPVDRDIQGNLAFARSLTFDRVESAPLATVVRWTHAVQNRLGPDRQAWAVLMLFWLIAALLTVGLARPRGFGAPQGWILSALLLLTVVAGSSWYTTLQRLDARRLAVVLEEVSEVLAGPGPNNPTLFTVHEGLTLEIRAERDEWIQVTLPNGLNGWISRKAVEQV